jgi:hypothetical protein
MARYITDGFNEWALCDRDDCQLKVVRPGKAQCVACDPWISPFYDDFEADQQ